MPDTVPTPEPAHPAWCSPRRCAHDDLLTEHRSAAAEIGDETGSRRVSLWLTEADGDDSYLCLRWAETTFGEVSDAATVFFTLAEATELHRIVGELIARAALS